MTAASELEVVLCERELRERIAELGAEIARDYAGRSLAVICVLKGSFVFCADLVRAIDLPMTIDFLGLSSYGEAQVSSGIVRITSDLSHPIEGRDVLLVEDIVDTGLTLAFLIEHLATRRPASVRICALLEKQGAARRKVDVDYRGFKLPEGFVVGYGLDSAERYRNLPYLAKLRAGCAAPA